MSTFAGRIFLLIALPVLAITPGLSGGGQAPGAQKTGSPPAGGVENWPREVKSGDTTFRVYQPQLESWDGAKLEARAAIEVRTAGSDKPVYGAALVVARTSVDKVNRMVSLEDLQVPRVLFPSAKDNEGLYLRILQNNVVPKVRQISLDRFEASLAIMEAGHKINALPLKNDPPRIVFSTKPTVLIYIDGSPALKPMKQAKVERVINTRPLIVKDSTSRYYVHLFDGWMESAAVFGPWAVCKNPPKELEAAKADAIASGQVDLLEGKADPEAKVEKPSLAKGPVPVVHVVTSPTELIVTEGDPKYVPIAGTALAFVENTTGNLFKHTAEQKIYVLISGRWFRSASMDGPWEFVPGGKLPPDFSRIPDDSPKENAKASVPGTPQAIEAVIASNIPQMATVNRKSAKLNPPQFDGEPVFKPVDGTSLQYAVNTATPIMKVNDAAYYAVENGVWFKSSSVKGAWVVADSVPPAVYGIPPSSPVHFVTYVKVYDANAETVTVGYTPGYYGTCITQGSGYVAVYGTGYPYKPWVGSVWYGPPVTYGFGSAVCYTPWAGWTFSFGFGWSWGYPMYPMGWGWGPYPWWGPIGWGCYYPYPYYMPPYYYGGVAWGPGGAVAWGPGGWAGTTGNVYQRWGSTTAVTRASGGFNAWTGNRWANQMGMAYNSKTGNLAAGQRAAVGNIYTGNYAYGRRGAITDTDTGRTISGGRMTVGNVGSGESGSVGWIRGENGGAIRIGDDIYAGHDGTVYRKGENGWEQNSGSGWSDVQRPGPQQGAGSVSDRAQSRQTPSTMPQQPPAGDRARPSTMQQGRASSPGQLSSQNMLGSLDRQQAARSSGQMRTQAYRSGAYGGGGFRRR